MSNTPGMKPDTPQSLAPTPFPREFLTGAAGTGKTTTIRARMEAQKKRKDELKQAGGAFSNEFRSMRSYAVLTASTGIAAVNLSGGTGETVTTLNSRLRFYDTADLQEKFKDESKPIHRAMKKIAEDAENLVIEEVSMVDSVQLDIVHSVIQELVKDQGYKLGLTLVGDFCQLKPVKGKYAFYANCWKYFQIEKLSKVYRQTNPVYLDALNAARRGDEKACATALLALRNTGNGSGQGITFLPRVNMDFDGTTIVPVNKQADEINQYRLSQLLKSGKPPIKFNAFRWGQQAGEWKQIPDEVTVCEGAYVMILANDSPNFTYANGSCGHIVDANTGMGTVDVELTNGNIVTVRKVNRCVYTRTAPAGYETPDPPKTYEEWKKDYEDDSHWTTDPPEIVLQAKYREYLRELTEEYKEEHNEGCNGPYYDFEREQFVLGAITYTPVRLAYASTVHKSQGLTLDKVQIDLSNKFFGENGMVYVALSRCRTPEGLTIVGDRKLIEARTNIHAEVLPWI